MKSHLSRHGGKVPHAADDSPAAHHSQQVVDHSKFTAIPEGISKSGIILWGQAHLNEQSIQHYFKLTVDKKWNNM